MHHKVQVWIAKGLPHEEKKILLFKVIESRGGGWHPITGSVEKDEQIMDGAIREMIEETRIDPSAFQAQWYDLNYSFQFEGNKKWQKGAVTEHAFGLWFQCDAESNALPLKLDPREHSDAKWVGVKEALAALSFPNQKAALELFVKKYL